MDTYEEFKGEKSLKRERKKLIRAGVLELNHFHLARLVIGKIRSWP